MMNEESPKVANQVGLALRYLLEAVGVAQRQETFEVICQWLETEDVSSIRRLTESVGFTGERESGRNSNCCSA